MIEQKSHAADSLAQGSATQRSLAQTHETTLTEPKIAQLVERARAAQRIIASWNQEQIDALCVAVGWSVYNDENIRILAESAVAETGMGRVEDKIHQAQE